MWLNPEDFEKGSVRKHACNGIANRWQMWDEDHGVLKELSLELSEFNKVDLVE